MVKYNVFLRFGTSQGPNLQENIGFLVFFVPRRLQKGPPEGYTHKTLVNIDRIWGVFLLSFCLPSAFFVGGLWICGWRCFGRPSVP
jgi:hypothetical protein